MVTHDPPPTGEAPAGRMERDRLLAGLNDAQLEAVTTDATPLAIIAGAGSGKTRVLTRRIARRVLDDEARPEHVLAVTFTRKAAAELRERLSGLGLPSPVHAGTFHALAYAQLRQRWAERGIDPPTLLDRKVGFVARLLPRGGRRDSTLPLDVVGEIEWAKARMVPAADYPVQASRAGRRPPIDAEAVAEVYTRYEREKLARRMVDFDDLLRLATRDLVADPTYAAARRWRYRHLFVDEFQDTNPLQFALLRAWLGEGRDLCVVGDPNQAIYTWNGADASHLLRFGEHFGGGVRVELADNYRSSPQILGVANTVLGTGPRSEGVRLRPQRGDGPLPTISAFPDEIAEARALARRIRDRHAPGRPWSDHAVLVRTNAQLAVIAEALGAAQIPHRSRAGSRLLDQPEVRDGLGALRRGPGSLRERLGALQESIETTGGEGRADLSEERTANVAELVRLGHEYLDLDPEGGAAGFTSWLTSTLRGDDIARGTDGVDLATFHAAKGLEWPIVHLAGLEEGLVPIHHAQTTEAVDEERRLLYVAITRARNELHCSMAQRRSFGARSLARRPSPYLATIELAIELLGEGGEPVDLAAAVAAQRSRLGEADGGGPGRRGRRTKGSPGPDPRLDAADRELLDRLKSWRLTQARAADVPAFVVFNDATLTEVATRRPSNRADLLDIAGIGPVKAERFGEQLLGLVRDAPRPPSAPPDPPAARRTARGRG